MTDIFELQSDFMFKAGQEVCFNKFYSQLHLYEKLVKEESCEFEEVEEHNHESAKEACDILVVTAGYLVSLLGKEKAQKAYELVHASNMVKLQGKIEKREDGKVLKSPEWKAEIKEKLVADLEALVKE